MLAWIFLIVCLLLILFDYLLHGTASWAWRVRGVLFLNDIDLFRFKDLLFVSVDFHNFFFNFCDCVIIHFN